MFLMSFSASKILKMSIPFLPASRRGTTGNPGQEEGRPNAPKPQSRSLHAI